MAKIVNREPVDLEHWVSSDVITQSWAIEDQMFEVWEKYLQTLGPAVVKRYREGKLQEFPHDHVFGRISSRMQKMAREILIAEELAQDDAEKQQQ